MSWRLTLRGRVLALLLPTLGCAREPCQKLEVAPPRHEESELLAGAADPRPRCDPASSTCGPAPLYGSENACFRPSARRKRLPESSADDRPPPPEYRCQHDGECMVNGCGNMCTSYKVGVVASECIGYEWLDQADFCGCIEGSCAFFRQ